MIKKAVAYIRVSTEKEIQEKSLENQKQQFLQFIKEEGYEYVDVYIDQETGTNESRKNLLRMLDDAEAGKFDMMVAKEFPRIARNVELSYKIKRLTENNNVRIYTMDGKVDSHDPSKMNLFGLYAWVAEQEAQATSDRIKAMMITNMKQGKFMGSTPPYAYRKEGKKLIIRSEETSTIVRRIFQMTIEGKAQDTIAKILISEGVKTPSQVLGKKNAGIYWHGTTVRKILENEAYIGHMVQHKQATKSAVNHNRNEIPKEQQIKVENTHEAIIDETVFYQVQKILEPKRKRGRGRTKAIKRLFTHKIYCADCGATMWYRKNGQVYLCSTHEKKGKSVCHCNHSIKEKAVETAILHDLKEFSKGFNINKIEKELKREATKLMTHTKSKIEIIDMQIKKNRMKYDRLLDMELEGRLTKDEYNEKASKLRNEHLNLTKELNELKLQDSNKGKAFDLSSIKGLINEYFNATKVDLKLVTSLVERIDVRDDKSFKITYAFAPMNK